MRWLKSLLIIAVLALTANTAQAQSASRRFNEAIADYNAGEYRAAASAFVELAEEGFAPAQGLLGQMFEFGRGVKKDLEQALTWYRRAAEGGDARAQNSLANLYRDGRGVERDYEEAARLYALAADQGYAAAQTNLGIAYRRGQGVEKNPAEAARLYRLAAEQGSARAQSNLGSLYYAGIGVEQSSDEAFHWFTLAAEQGIAEAQANLGAMYHYAEGVEQDFAAAMKWYRASAEQGNAFGQSNLGELYRNGDGVAQDFDEAIRWYQLSAEQGNAYGQINLGELYRDGDGVPQDFAEARRWFTLAAEQGNPHAEERVGDLYRNGWGVEQDFKTALRFYRKAAQREEAAQIKVGLAYENGEGVPRDLEEAAKWYELAAQGAGKEARTARVMLEAVLKLAEAEAEAPEPQVTPAAERPVIDEVNCTAPEVAEHGSDEVRVALIVGNTNYQNVPVLPNARCDAESMAELLRNAGFDVILAIDADKATLDTQVRDFSRKALEADVSLFFYSGHGLQVDGKNYMVPTDAKVADRTAITFELIDMDLVTSFMTGDDKVAIVLLDACRDNPFAETLARSVAGNSATRSLEIANGLAPISSAGGGVVIGFATAPGDVADDSAGKNHSPFTTALLEEMPTAGLEFELVMKRVKARVVELTKDTERPQRPWTNSDLTTEFFLVPKTT